MSDLDEPEEYEELLIVLNAYGLCANGMAHQQIERTLSSLMDLALRHVPHDLRDAFAEASPHPSLREAIELCHLAAKLQSPDLAVKNKKVMVLKDLLEGEEPKG